MNGGIVFQDDIATVGGNSMIPRDRRKVGYHPDDVGTLLEYSDRSFQGDMATVLPLTDSFGNIPGTSNVFGRIVMGKSFRGEGMSSQPLAEEVVNDFRRITKASRISKGAKVDLSPAERKAIASGKVQLSDVVVDDDDDDEEVEVNPREFAFPDTELGPVGRLNDGPVVPVGGPIATKDVETGIVAVSPTDILGRIMAPTYQPPPAPVKAEPSVIASLDTPWCDIEGRYVDVIVSDKVIVLVSDPDYNVFTPKPSSQKLVIKTRQESYDVVYYGMSYKYEGNIHQIYVRH